MGPNRAGKHTRAQNKVIFDDRALKVFLTLALVIGFAPIAKDSAAAVAEQAAGGFVAADSIVGGVADAGASGDATDALNEIPNEADADGISAVDEPKDEATDEQPVAGAADGDEAVSGDADATDAPSEEAIDSSEEAAEAPDDSADEDAAAAEESEFGPEGAPNSFRYVDGVP